MEGDPTDGESAHSPNRKQLDKYTLHNVHERLEQPEMPARNISGVGCFSFFESTSNIQKDETAQTLTDTEAVVSELHELSSQRSRQRFRDESLFAHKLTGSEAWEL